MADENEILSRQVLAKVVALLEEVAHELRESPDAKTVAETLDRYAEEIRGDLHRGSIH